jgi:alanyl-tRNA synthetase
MIAAATVVPARTSTVLPFIVIENDRLTCLRCVGTQISAVSDELRLMSVCPDLLRQMVYCSTGQPFANQYSTHPWRKQTRRACGSSYHKYRLTSRSPCDVRHPPIESNSLNVDSDKPSRANGSVLGHSNYTESCCAVKDFLGDLILPTSERLYYSDSFLKTFTGSVTGVRGLAGSNGEPVWQVSLDRTAFYPTSGGQPFDTGEFRVTSRNGAATTISVDQVEEDEEGSVLHFLRAPLAAGTQVEGQIDWERRFDHMQQHTGQHLLSAVFLRELQAPTVSFHLGESTSTIDLACGPLAHHSLERMERIANQMIAEDRAVTAHFVPRDDAEVMLAAGRLRKLPDRQGTIRLIDIADYDKNACGGTHVHSTGQIGGLQVRTVEKVSRGVRVEFVCGLRAVRSARTNFAILRETSALLSTAAADLPATVGRLLTEGKTNTKERQRLREELALFQAATLVMKEPLESGLRLIERTFKDRDRDYVRLLASRTAATAPQTAVIFSASETVPVRVFIARSSDLNFNCGQILREALAQLGLRGGGSPDLAQGDVPAEHKANLRASLIDAIHKAVPPRQS